MALLFDDISRIRIKETASVTRALSHPKNQRLLELIHEHTEITVTDLYVLLRWEQSVCSQRLKMLRDAGLVEIRKAGKKRLYSINYVAMSKYSVLLSKIGEALRSYKIDAR